MLYIGAHIPGQKRLLCIINTTSVGSSLLKCTNAVHVSQKERVKVGLQWCTPPYQKGSMVSVGQQPDRPRHDHDRLSGPHRKASEACDDSDHARSTQTQCLLVNPTQKVEHQPYKEGVATLRGGRARLLSNREGGNCKT